MLALENYGVVQYYTFYGVNTNSWYRHSKNYIYIKITAMNSNFYILYYEKVLCSIFGHISPPHEL